MFDVFSANCKHSLPLEVCFVLSGLQIVQPGIVGAPTIGEVLVLSGDLDDGNQGQDQYQTSSPPSHYKDQLSFGLDGLESRC